MRFSVQSIRKKEQIMDGLEFDGLDDLVDGLENAVSKYQILQRQD